MPQRTRADTAGTTVAISMAEEHNLEPDNTEPDLGNGDPTGFPPGDTTGLSQGGVPALPVIAKGMTPGQRLAAKKAQKSVKKKEFKDELQQKEQEAQEQAQAQAQRNATSEAPALPEEVQKVATDFSDFVHENQGRIIGGIVAFIVISVAVILLQRFTQGGNAEAASALKSAIETSTATIDAEDKDGKTDDGKPVFATREDRTKKSLQAFASVSKKFSGDAIASWAKLGEAAAQVELKAYDKAVALYDAAYAAGKDDPALAARALEGQGIALEAAGKRDEALKRYEQLKGVTGQYNKDTAEYHVARLTLAKGDRAGATKMFKTLYDRLSDVKEGEPASKYLKGEVEIRLAELDSSLVDKGTTPGDGAESFSQEQLQQLLEQLKMKGGMPQGAGAE